MGLQKEIDRDATGVPMRYWHLAARQDFIDAKRIEVTFMGFADEAAYKAGRASAASPLRYTLVPADFPPGTDLHAVSTAMLYSAVKAKAATAAAQPIGNPSRLPDVHGVATDPALAGAADAGIG